MVKKIADVRKIRNLPTFKVFRQLVWDYWKENGRHDLPWRKTKNPYRILVSEVMLQQTQVPRVIEKYAEFLTVFPTVESLAKAPLQSVLRVWSGMGYNRRAKFLKRAAEEIVTKYKGKVPRDVVTLRSLPGIGPYTASAVLVFAYNIPDTLIETNVRAVYIHHFFPNPDYKGPSFVKNLGITSQRTVLCKPQKKVSDRELLPLIAGAAEGQDPREWHWALMDYGSYLKKTHPNPSRKSMHHVKQSRFEGSLRQVRGAILKVLKDGPQSESNLLKLPFEQNRIESALASLLRDEMLSHKRKLWKIA